MLAMVIGGTVMVLVIARYTIITLFYTEVIEINMDTLKIDSKETAWTY